MTKEIYQKSVDILLDAYNESKLFRGMCDACAVGNILGTSDWQYIIGCADEGGRESAIYRIRFGEPTEKQIIVAQEIIKNSGLTELELIEIEEAFESNAKNQFTGLCAVLDVMKDMVEEDVEHKENVERLELIYEKVK